jgi:TatD DNase family protein
MGTVKAVCISAEKGTAKRNVGQAELVENHGLKGDAHAGSWHRQVSLLSLQKIDAFRAADLSGKSEGAGIIDGDFGENLVVDGIDFSALPEGTVLRCGEALLEMTQIGKECHSHCAIFKRMGDCIMPREGVFARVIHGGIIKTGDTMLIEQSGAANEPQPGRGSGEGSPLDLP